VPPEDRSYSRNSLSESATILCGGRRKILAGEESATRGSARQNSELASIRPANQKQEAAQDATRSPIAASGVLEDQDTRGARYPGCLCALTDEILAALYSFTHPSEAELLKRFYLAGNTYSSVRAITDAIDDYATGPKTLIDSSYWKACCSAAEGLLAAYVHKVAAVESECLTEAEPLPLCYLWLQVEESVHDLELLLRTFHDLSSATSASGPRDTLLSALHKKYTSHAGSGLRPLQALHAAVVSTFALHLQGELKCSHQRSL
jgi:hypothetical protein